MPAPNIRNTFDFKDLHEVVGYGRAMQPSGGRSSQVLVEVVLAPVEGADGYRFDRKVQTVSKWVGCGELGMVPVGSRWRLGKAMGQRVVKDEYMGYGIVEEIRPDLYGEWSGAKGAPFFPTRGLAGTRCFVLKLRDGNHDHVMIPVTEVVRRVFGRSSDLLLQVFGGRVADEVERFQVDPARIVSHHDGVLEMRYRTEPHRPEASLAAMILTDAALARSFYDVRRNLEAAVGWENDRAVVIDTTCPLVGGEMIHFEGRHLGRRHGTADQMMFLVTGLRSFSYAKSESLQRLVVSFATRRLDRETPQGDARQRRGAADTIHVQAERDPAPGRLNFEIDMPGAEIVLDEDFEYVREPDAPAAIAPELPGTGKRTGNGPRDPPATAFRAAIAMSAASRPGMRPRSKVRTCARGPWPGLTPPSRRRSPTRRRPPRIGGYPTGTAAPTKTSASASRCSSSVSSSKGSR